MTPFDPLVGEFRVHYAGFFDPGFGNAGAGGLGARAVLERRNPLLLFLLSGLLLLRFDTRQLSALLFQLPPRMTRLEPLLPVAHSLEFIFDQLPAQRQRVVDR